MQIIRVPSPKAYSLTFILLLKDKTEETVRCKIRWILIPDSSGKGPGVKPHDLSPAWALEGRRCLGTLL